MTPTAYLSELEQRLACIPAEDRTEIIQFYQEFLEDGGEAAMAELGTPDVLAQRILQENGYTAGAPEAPQGSKKKSKSHTVAIWVLLILSSPIWLSLVISFLSIIFSLLVTLVSVLFSLAVSALACVGYGIVMLFHYIPVGIFSIGAGIACGGITVLLCKPCWIAMKAICRFSERALRWFGRACFGKEL